MDPKHELTIARLKERKAARRQSEVAREVLDALNRGWIESKNLVEWLSVDRLRLAKVVLPELEMDEIDFQSLGQRLRGKSVLQQSKMLGAELAQLLSPTDPRVKRLENHPSDVVREWGALIIGHWESMSFSRRLAWMKPYADDRNPGTREIAWIALRQHVIDDPIEAVSKLMPWTGSRNERLRRYASEITRPCGVWCQHIDALKRDPADRKSTRLNSSHSSVSRMPSSA